MWFFICNFVEKKTFLWYYLKQGEFMNKEHILKSNLDFQRIIKSNRPYKYKEYVIYLEKNNLDNYRFGFSVGKKNRKSSCKKPYKKTIKKYIIKKKI